MVGVAELLLVVLLFVDMAAMTTMNNYKAMKK
jgi:hypothetical protein